MHARDLVDVAGLVALNGPLLVCGARPPASAPLEQYWATSRFRFENWTRLLRDYAEMHEPPSPEDLDRWIEIRAALDEIFVSEILTRVWSAVLVACDRRARTNLAEPIARSVLGSHIEARHRALALLVHGGAVGVNDCRGCCCHWEAAGGALWVATAGGACCWPKNGLATGVPGAAYVLIAGLLAATAGEFSGVRKSPVVGI